MNLEIGDYFAVERGRMLSPEQEGPFGPIPAQYDRIYDGVVFKVLLQEHDMVAAEIIFPHSVAGQTFSLNVEGMELMGLSPAYVNALQGGKQFKAPVPSQSLSFYDILNSMSRNDVRP